jgi:hypothetical protein
LIGKVDNEDCILVTEREVKGFELSAQGRQQLFDGSAARGTAAS